MRQMPHVVVIWRYCSRHFVTGKLLHSETKLNYNSVYTIKNDCFLSINIHAVTDQYGDSKVLVNGGCVLTVIDDGSVSGFRNTLSACIPISSGSILSFDRGDSRNNATIWVMELEAI